MSTDLTETSAPTNPLQLIHLALEKGLDPEKLYELAERWQQQEASQRFGDALARFQSRMPQVYKKNLVSNKDGSPRYRFAGFEDVMRIAQPYLSECCISVSFSTPKEDGDTFTMVCHLRVGSHAEDRPFSGPRPNVAAIAGSLRLTEPQAYGLVLSYYKRYALCAAVGIVVTDEDNDAQGQLATITPEQVGQLNDLIVATDTDLGRFLTWANIGGLDEMPARDFSKAIAMLRKKKSKNGGGK